MTTGTPTPTTGGTTRLGNELWEWILVLWRTGNLWLRLIALDIVFWPVVMTTIALYTNDNVTGLVAFIVPLVELLFVTLGYPLITGATLWDDLGRKTFGVLLAVTGAKMAVGVYLVLVPVRNSPGSLILLALSIYGLIFLAPTVLRKLRGLGVGVMALVTILVTISFIPAIRVEMEGWWENMTNGASATSGGGQAAAMVDVLYADVPGSFAIPNQSGMRMTWYGPADTEVCRGGSCVPLRDWDELGLDPVAYELRGPTGTVTVCVAPHGVRTLCDDLRGVPSS
ncbi:MAG: hypothetical protein A3G58_01500 [Candidatus Colwellbacteria bacterium RIFCSPLOWO2_12_FULL_46_17]|uniref:Uncharacterized protein n=1 Tax=Candidatus Colwellbacteria bacterium RIFCSPLOWO2_12_FULL_46_17 TaxID=1797695 RepID=A0A1G1ZD24_9BACT|nr:MAG: hypothetical protein A3G58_01500 [Candidatus Colwellbacteria bacterium RIFCSPLOWO2_12_FULL_46_17]